MNYLKLQIVVQTPFKEASNNLLSMSFLELPLVLLAMETLVTLVCIDACSLNKLGVNDSLQ
jgi:hypothetical protein